MEDALPLRGLRRIKAEQPEDDTPARTSATTRTGGDGDGEPVLVARLSGLLNIEMAQAALEEAAIPAYIKRESVGVVYGFSMGPLGSAEVWVPRPLAEQAEDVLIGIGVLHER